MATRTGPGKQTDLSTERASKRRTFQEERLKQLEAEALLFASLTEQARGKKERLGELGDDDEGMHPQMGPAVTAAQAYAATTTKIADLKAAMLADEMDEEERLEFTISRSSADASWVATAKMSAQLAEMRAQRQAAIANESARVAALAADSTDIDFLRATLQELMSMAMTGTGLAKVQALKAATKVRAELSIALKAAEGDKEMSDAEVRLAIEDQIPDIPDEHLAIYVRGYCERHGLPMPHRVAVGGRVNC